MRHFCISSATVWQGFELLRLFVHRRFALSAQLVLIGSYSNGPAGLRNEQSN